MPGWVLLIARKGLVGILFATLAAGCAPDGEPDEAKAEAMVPVSGAAAQSLPACSDSSPQTGDVDGDGRPDTAEVEDGAADDWIVRVHLGSGGIEEVRVPSECATLLGLADVNSDGRQEIWFKRGIGNTAHNFDLVTWTGEALRVVVGSDIGNPLVVGWGFSGGATLWCADATGDGRMDIVRREFDRTADGFPENERESVYQLRDSELSMVSEGPPRTPLPGTSSALVCGTVSW